MSENKKTEKPGFFARAKDFVVALAIVIGVLDTASSFLVKQLMTL